MPCSQLAVIVWADASNFNRPDKGSTMGIVAGIAPNDIMRAKKQPTALIHWRSAKTPRQRLGSNRAEVQAITEGKDLCFRLRALVAEINGKHLTRENLKTVNDLKTAGALVMDSRGIYDSATRNISSLHGLRSGRAGYELTLAVSHALKINTAQLADCLTKGRAAKKMMLDFMAGGQKWSSKFTAGRKVKKAELQEQNT